MTVVQVDDTNIIDKSRYSALIVPGQKAIEYVAPFDSTFGQNASRRFLATVEATISRKSFFASKAPTLLIYYGIGALAFDDFCNAVRKIISIGDIAALRSASDARAISEICRPYEIVADKGELHLSRLRSIPLLFLTDRNASQRVY